MATGEKTYSTKGREVKKMSFKPIPAGDYELKLSNKTEIRTAAGEGKDPYVNCSFFAGSTGEDGGKDKMVFHRFMLSLKPGKDGVVMPDRGSGINGFAKGLGTDFKASVLKGPSGNLMINPRDVVSFLKENEGTTVRANIKVQAGTTEYPNPQNIINQFEEASGSGEEAENDGDALEAEAEFDGSEDTEAASDENNEAGFDSESGDSEVSADESEDFEAIPPSKKQRPVLKAAPKLVNGTAKKMQLPVAVAVKSKNGLQPRR